jgi:hypothetical protein
MSHLSWLHEAHLKRIQHLFPKPRGVARVDEPPERYRTMAYGQCWGESWQLRQALLEAV